MFERIKHMLIKEFTQVLRDARLRAVILVMPVVQLLIFGYVVTTDVRHVALGIRDLDNSVASRELIARFVGSGYFDDVARADSPQQVRELLDSGQARVVLCLDHGYEAQLRAGRPAPVQLLLDGTDSNTTSVVMSYSQRILADFAVETLTQRITRLSGVFRRPAHVELHDRAWFNPNLESRNFYVPGVIALIVTLVTLLLTSMSVVREKEIGTIEQIMVTPITPLEFILGKTVPFALISFVDVLLITAVGAYWFDVPVRGSLLLLLVGVSLYLMTTLGVGLVISTFSHTQQQAMMSTFFFYMPAMLLSGFMFPIANMPEPVQWLTVLNPLRYFLVIIRGIFLKGVGLEVLAPQLAALAVIGAVTLGLAVRRFHKTLG